MLDRLNNDDGVDGILVQLPLPKHISAEAVAEADRARERRRRAAPAQFRASLARQR